MKDQLSSPPEAVMPMALTHGRQTVHRMGVRCRITERDLNTLIAIYPAIGEKVSSDSTR